MNKDINKITEKVKKLLAMADVDGGATDNEREIALRQATKLMDMYALDIDSVNTDTSDPRGKSDFETGVALWKPMVFSAIGKLYGCLVYMQKSGRNKTVKIIGKESSRITIMAMSAWLISSIEKECANSGLKRGAGRLDSFKKGAALGIFATVDKIIEARKCGETVGSQSKALVVVESYKQELALNEDFLKNEGVKLSTGRSLKLSNHGAFSQGKAYGESLNLSGQISGAGQAKLR